MSDRELNLMLADAFLEGYMKSLNDDSIMRSMIITAKSAIKFELGLMAELDHDTAGELW